MTSALQPPFPREDLQLVLDQTRRLWEPARGAKFFFTGGTGFVGRWMLESLFHISDALGLEVAATVLTRSPASFIERCPHLAARCTLLPGDVRDFAFPADRFKYLVHAAADTGDVPDAIYAGTMRVLDFAVRQPCYGILYLSSGAVYNDRAPHPDRYQEDLPLSASTDYGRGKMWSEQLFTHYAEEYQLPVRLARLFAFIGPGLPLDSHYAAGHFIRDALAGRPIKVIGNGQPLRTWLYAADMAAWLWTILFAGRPARPYNVGAHEVCSIGGLARTIGILARSGSPLEVQIAQPPDHLRLPPRYVPDVSRARDELGLAPTVALTDGIRRWLAWLRAP